MATEDFERKLTATLSTDVEGYSRLMREDEGAPVRTITAYREVINSIVRKHRGRVVDSPADNILAEFVSVVDAVRSAVEIQEVSIDSHTLRVTEQLLQLPSQHQRYES